MNGRTALRRLVTQVRAARAFSAVVLRQLLRDRTALFFMLALPVAIMVIIGSTFGGQGRLEVGLVAPDGVVAGRVEASLRRAEGVHLHRYADLGGLQRALRRFSVAGGLVVPAQADQQLAAGEAVQLSLLVPATNEDAVTVRRTLGGIIDEAATPLAAARFAAAETGIGTTEALEVADRLDAAGAGGSIAIEVVDVGPHRAVVDNRFSRTAPQNLVLFTFITALTSATLLVKARRVGVLRRARCSPTGMGTLLGGMAAGWFLLCLLQSSLIIVVGAVGFGVSWGNPLAAAALVLAFDAVGCGAGLLVGSLGVNEDRVSAMMPVVGIVTGALGGCMVPLEVFPTAMVDVARVTPHYWAVDGWDTLVFDRGGLADIAPNLAVLVAIAVLLSSVATLTMRRALGAGR